MQKGLLQSCETASQHVQCQIGRQASLHRHGKNVRSWRMPATMIHASNYPTGAEAALCVGCAKQYRLRMESFNDTAGAIGCKGISGFSRLPYYRCSTPTEWSQSQHVHHHSNALVLRVIPAAGLKNSGTFHWPMYLHTEFASQAASLFYPLRMKLLSGLRTC